jgi:hypothetical protein
MNIRVEVEPDLLRWARDRSGLDDEAIHRRFPHFEKWQKRELQPTLRQLEHFAEVTRTPVGYLFLQAPPVEKVPIPDFRTVGNKRVGKPSPDLLETIYICQQRQEWYRDFLISNKEEGLKFVGSVTTNSDTRTAALAISDLLGFSIDERRQIPTWVEALRQFIEQADRAGILVMVSGVVGNNNYRKLDPSEFRGFALSDPLAPLIFINGSDTKSAQMFTIAHYAFCLPLSIDAVFCFNSQSSSAQCAVNSALLPSFLSSIARRIGMTCSGIKLFIKRWAPAEVVPFSGTEWRLG